MDWYPWSFDSIHSHCHDDVIILYSILKNKNLGYRRTSAVRPARYEKTGSTRTSPAVLVESTFYSGTTGEVRVDAVRYWKYITGTDRRCNVLSRDADFLRDKTSLSSEVPCFCSIFNSIRSSNSTNVLITMASLHSNAPMASFLYVYIRALLPVRI
jgi:hypothetical protein